MSERRRRVALLATAGDPGEAEAWASRLREAGISSIARGHRPEGSRERRPLFAGVDVYVPAALLREARELLAGTISAGQLPKDEAFPWAWLAGVLGAVVALVLTVVVIVLA